MSLTCSDSTLGVPTILPDCPDGPICDLGVDSVCVTYSGPDIPTLGVLSGDNVDSIIRKWGINLGTQSINVLSTTDVTLSGNGLTGTPLRASTIIVPDAHNLLQRGNAGLFVNVNLCMIQDFASLVTSDTEAHTLFCSLVAACASGYCGTATDLSVSYVTTVLRATWTPFITNALSQDIEYKKLTDTAWTGFSTVGASVATIDIPGIFPNTLYQVRVKTECYTGGPAYNIPAIASTAVCPVVTTIPSYDNIAFSIPYSAHDFTLATVTLELVSDSSVVGVPQIFDLAVHPAAMISGSFKGLTSETAYKILVQLDTPLGTYPKSCGPYNVTTIASPTCGIPTGLGGAIV